jgi:hypothetical protein
LHFRPLIVANVSHDGNGADAAFDDDIRRSTDHDQMFDIVTTHQHQPAAGIHGGGVQHLQSRLPVASTANERRRTATSADDPQYDCQKQKRQTDTHNGHDQLVAIGANKFVHHLHGVHPFSLLFGKSLPFFDFSSRVL